VGEGGQQTFLLKLSADGGFDLTRLSEGRKKLIRYEQFKELLAVCIADFFLRMMQVSAPVI
jgi:hypothetical protein